MEETIEKIYKTLICRRFRSGPLPDENRRNLILEKIVLSVSKNLPIKILMFWGGCKNPNLPLDKADLCEESTLNNYRNLDKEIRGYYKPGINIIICPGDSRVEKINLIPHKKTKEYIDSLTKISQKGKYQNLFTVTPLSALYLAQKDNFKLKLGIAKNKISKEIINSPNFEKMVTNAEKNMFIKNSSIKGKRRSLCTKAAMDYLIYRVAEEECQIFEEFNDCIRAFSIKYTPFYKPYIQDVNKTTPHLDCHLIFYTGGKGNITQPWQAIGKKIDNKIIFLSQERLKNSHN